MTVHHCKRSLLGECQVVIALALVLFVALVITPETAQAQTTEPTPSTSTTTAPETSVPVEPEPSSPGLFDISGKVGAAIDDWFKGLVTSAINPTLELLGQSVLSSPDVTEQGQVRQVWTIAIAIADTLFVLMALVGGVVVMTHDSMQSRYSIKEIAPRLVVAVITANVSLLICANAIQLANAMSRAFLGEGLDPNEAVGGIGAYIVDATGTGGFLILLALGATVMAIALACVYLARAAIVVLLVAVAPVALACHALPQTERIAMLWWRSLAACLVVQIAQALVLITTIRVFLAPDGAGALGVTAGDGLINLLTTICLFWIMLKIPAWAGRVVFGPGGSPIKAAGHRVYVSARTAVAAAA
jgi:hypothetical protein